MKTHSLWSALLCALLLGLATHAHGQAGGSKRLYDEGVAAFEAQNWALAVEKLTPVYNQTRNPRVEYYLRNAKLKLAQGEAPESIEKKLSRVIIPDIEFDAAELPTTLDFLRTKTAEISKGLVRTNFIYKRDPNNPVVPVVTLKLSNIPVTDVLRYIGDLTNTKFKFEAYAVVGMPASSAEAEKANPKKAP
jgi:hypothetical protein